MGQSMIKSRDHTQATKQSIYINTTCLIPLLPFSQTSQKGKLEVLMHSIYLPAVASIKLLFVVLDGGKK